MVWSDKTTMSARDDFLKLYIELEYNLDPDRTIEERMALYRLQEYADKHFNTNLDELTLKESREANEYLRLHSIKQWRNEIRKRRIQRFFPNGLP